MELLKRDLSCEEATTTPVAATVASTSSTTTTTTTTNTPRATGATVTPLNSQNSQNSIDVHGLVANVNVKSAIDGDSDSDSDIDICIGEAGRPPTPPRRRSLGDADQDYLPWDQLQQRASEFQAMVAVINVRSSAATPGSSRQLGPNPVVTAASPQQPLCAEAPALRVPPPTSSSGLVESRAPPALGGRSRRRRRPQEGLLPPPGVGGPLGLPGPGPGRGRGLGLGGRGGQLYLPVRQGYVVAAAAPVAAVAVEGLSPRREGNRRRLRRGQSRALVRLWPVVFVIFVVIISALLSSTSSSSMWFGLGMPACPPEDRIKIGKAEPFPTLARQLQLTPAPSSIWRRPNLFRAVKVGSRKSRPSNLNSPQLSPSPFPSTSSSSFFLSSFFSPFFASHAPFPSSLNSPTPERPRRPQLRGGVAGGGGGDNTAFLRFGSSSSSRSSQRHGSLAGGPAASDSATNADVGEDSQLLEEQSQSQSRSSSSSSSSAVPLIPLLELEATRSLTEVSKVFLPTSDHVSRWWADSTNGTSSATVRPHSMHDGTSMLVVEIVGDKPIEISNQLTNKIAFQIPIPSEAIPEECMLREAQVTMSDLPAPWVRALMLVCPVQKGEGHGSFTLDGPDLFFQHLRRLIGGVSARGHPLLRLLVLPWLILMLPVAWGRTVGFWTTLGGCLMTVASIAVTSFMLSILILIVQRRVVQHLQRWRRLWKFASLKRFPQKLGEAFGEAGCCCICLAENRGEGGGADQDCIALLPCRHAMHDDCYKTWLASESYPSNELICPLCRGRSTGIGRVC